MSSGNLDRILTDLDGSGYGGYRRLTGTPYSVGDPRDGLTLTVDHVQADPFAPPSAVHVDVPVEYTGIPADLLADPVPVRDHLTRRLVDAVAARNPRGGKAAGSLAVDRPGQEILDRSSVTLSGGTLRLRLEAALPAHGRRINGRAAADLLCGVLPDAVGDAVLDLPDDLLDPLRRQVATWRDQQALRAALPAAGLVAFVAQDAVLPRASGDSQRPLPGAVPFTVPETLRHTVTLPDGRTVTGLGVPAGVTLIVGGGYHGKSTLLKALERGVYDHVPGDGREFVVSVADATALRAEDGRAVTAVDISPFLHDLPGGTDTTCFSTTNASGSTSQAAGLVEAVEAGATTLLIDEDTSATNFMVRDARMRALIPAAKEPITPLVDRVRRLYTDHGISTVLVAGGSAAFLDVADTVIMMDAYHPVDVTDRARGLAVAETELPADPGAFTLSPGRTPTSHFSPAGDRRQGAPGRGPQKGRAGSPKGPRPPRATDRSTVRVGDGEIDLAACAQLVDDSQTRALAAVLPLLDRESGTLRQRVESVHTRIADEGWEVLGRDRVRVTGRMALPRVAEIVAAVNRWRGLQVSAPHEAR